MPSAEKEKTLEKATLESASRVKNHVISTGSNLNPQAGSFDNFYKRSYFGHFFGGSGVVRSGKHLKSQEIKMECNMTNLQNCLFTFIVFGNSFLFGLNVFSAANPRERTATFSVNSSRSGVLFDAGLYYGQTEATADPALGNEWKNLTSIYDIKLGYITDSSIYLGTAYSTRNDSSVLTTSNGGTAAVGLGYFWGSGFHLRSFYRINETFGDYSEGSGFQADVGYMTNMSSNFYLGLLISHRQVTFTKNNTISNFKSLIKKDTQPMVTLGFLIN